MKRRDIFIMNWLFASLYFPTSIFLWFLKPTGTFIGILVVGLVFHIILTILLVLMLWVEPHNITPKSSIEVIAPKPKRAYKKKNKPEVENNEEEKIVTGIEPTPEMRTDVNLDQLNDDSDDVLD